MGNIFFEQKKFPNAIKMYRMALDQIPNTAREIRFKIMRNIGNAFVRMGQYQDAMQVRVTLTSLVSLRGLRLCHSMRNIGNAFVRMGQYQDAMQVR
eukprot:1180341-Prorocentrum_minimum.AAC.2